jgi:hypothetical protein
MGFLRNLKLWLLPLRMTDPDFGNLVFIHISKWPERSYWECEWMFPATGTVTIIAFPGDENGPRPEPRPFYLGLPGRFGQILAACRPRLEQVFNDHLHRPLPQDIFTVVKLAGFSLEDPKEQPARWDISFETTGYEYLGISIPFVGDAAMEAEVDIC